MTDDFFGRQITVPLQITGAMPVAVTPMISDDGGGVWTMTDAEFQESLRKAKEDAWDEGYEAADYDAPHSIKTDNPYRLPRG